MELTEERVREIVCDELSTFKADRNTPAVREFKRKLEQWLGEMPNKERNANRSAIYALIKTRLGLISIQKLSDEQVPEATELFEKYRNILS